METVLWKNTFNTGIEEIDNQHKQLLDYLNQLGRARLYRDKKEYFEVIAGLYDYTMSHFAFEEALMEEAGYSYVGPHKHVHQLLIKKVADFDGRLKAGEEIADELYAFLRRWLINHIQRDDAAYVTTVSAHFKRSAEVRQTEKEHAQQMGWMSRLVKKFFG